MRTKFSSSMALAAWERAHGRSPLVKGLVLLSLAAPELSSEQAAEMSIGDRDRALFGLRRRMFGDKLVTIATCPDCGEKVELDCAVNDLCVTPPPVPLIDFESGGKCWQLRLPNSADLIAVERFHDRDVRRRALLVRCLRSEEGTAHDAVELAAETADAAVSRLAEIDPQVDVQLGVECPDCGHTWSLRFDIVSFLWAELDAWARRLTLEIHALASAYGWTERDILALSPWRRQLYLEMVRR